VENGAGLTVQRISTPVLIDRTAPTPPVVIDQGNYTNHRDQLRFSWKWPIGDEESGIREYWYALTTQQAISGNEEWYCSLLEKEVFLDELELLHGGTYYLAVKAINNAGLESVGFSDGILVDTTAPTPPTVIDYGDFSLSKSELKVSMVASDAESGIAEYRLSLGTLEDPDSIFGDRRVMSSGGMEHLNLTGLNLEEGQVYLFTVSAVNQAGIVSMVSTSDGIMVDSKPPVVHSVNMQGRYLTDGTKLVFDWTSEPTPSGIIDAQYAISEDPNGKDLLWHTADLSGSQSLIDLQLEEGKTYYVFVRVQNRALAENTPTVWSNPGRSHPFSIDTTPPEILKIHNPVLMSQRFLLQWEARDDVSGITEYRYAVGSYRRGTDVTDGWRSISTQQTTVSFYLDDLPLHNNHDCYISVMAKNGAGLWSPVYTSEAIKTELTPPNVTEFSYLSSYINRKDLKDGININWAADDPESGMAAYRVCFVTDKNKRNLDGAPVVLTNRTSGAIHMTEFNLVDGGRYYLAFQAQNSLGAWSEIAYSGEILVDFTPPVVSIFKEVEEFVTNDGFIDLTWLISEAGYVEYKLTYPSGHEPEPETVAIFVEYLHSFELPIENEGIYTLALKPTDLAGNVGEVVSEAIRLNAKPIANPGPDRRVFKGGTITFTPEVSDSDGTIVEYLWDFGNGETSQDAEPTCNYQELGEYLVTLNVMDNDGKWSEPRSSKVIVTNTSCGELTMDEDWEGDADISGEIIVPQGVTLKIKAGTTIDFSGEYQIIVYGRILIEGTAEQPVIIGAKTPTWGGIRLISTNTGSTLQYVRIYAATAGLVAAESDLTVEDCLFAHNRIGIHLLNSAPLLTGCIFQENLVYGVKEDNGATPTVIDCSFIRNTIDYYEDLLGIIRIEQLNELDSNQENTVVR
jgi:PKD repeat protein